MPENERLYFIAIIPPKPVYTKIRELQFEMYHKYGCKKVLKSPAHLTVQVPFKRNSNIEEPLIKKLKELGRNTSPFQIQLSNFGSFIPHVIYVNPIQTEGIMNFRESITRLMRNDFQFTDEDIVFTKFNPHFTLAFRDLKPKFWEAWKEFANREFEEAFVVDRFFLFKHNYKVWEILETISLSGS